MQENFLMYVWAVWPGCKMHKSYNSQLWTVQPRIREVAVSLKYLLITSTKTYQTWEIVTESSSTPDKKISIFLKYVGSTETLDDIGQLIGVTECMVINSTDRCQRPEYLNQLVHSLA